MDPKRRQKWIEQVQRPAWTPSNRSVLCSKHFLKTDFEVTCEFSVLKRLKKSAIPSVFKNRQHSNVKEKTIAKDILSDSEQQTVFLHREVHHVDHTYAKKSASDQYHLWLREHDYCVSEEAHVVNKRLQLALRENEKLRAKVTALQKLNSKIKTRCQSLKQLALTLRRKGLSGVLLEERFVTFIM